MTYVLVGIAAAAIASYTTIAVLMARMAKNNRSDLRELVESTKSLSEAQRDNDGYKRSVEDLEHAIDEKDNDLRRTRAALHTAGEALGRANEKLATVGDASGVAVDIDSILGQLRGLGQVPAVPGPEAAEDDNGSG